MNRQLFRVGCNERSIRSERWIHLTIIFEFATSLAHVHNITGRCSLVPQKNHQNTNTEGHIAHVYACTMVLHAATGRAGAHHKDQEHPPIELYELMDHPGVTFAWLSAAIGDATNPNCLSESFWVPVTENKHSPA